MTINDTKLTAAGFKLTVVEKPRARQVLSPFMQPYWIVYRKSTVGWKYPLYGKGRTIEEAFRDYQRKSDNPVFYLHDSYWDK